jgi:folylpolyglutamate synthase/dihydropteroate synthase
LSQISKLIIVVAPRVARALPSKSLAQIANAAGIPVIDGGSVIAGLRKAEQLADASSLIFITGSHYVVGEAIGVLKSRGLA